MAGTQNKSVQSRNETSLRLRRMHLVQKRNRMHLWKSRQSSIPWVECSYCISDWRRLILLWLPSLTFDSTHSLWRGGKNGRNAERKMQSRCQTSTWLTTYRSQSVRQGKAMPSHISTQPDPSNITGHKILIFHSSQYPLAVNRIYTRLSMFQGSLSPPPLTVLPGYSHSQKGHTLS